jgi:Mg-chelatase subunit ChlD
MFGMEKRPKSEAKVFLFDLEKELVREEYRMELAKKLEMRIRKIKELLHQGAKKEDYEQLC